MPTSLLSLTKNNTGQNLFCKHSNPQFIHQSNNYILFPPNCSNAFDDSSFKFSLAIFYTIAVNSLFSTKHAMGYNSTVVLNILCNSGTNLYKNHHHFKGKTAPVSTKPVFQLSHLEPSVLSAVFLRGAVQK